LKKFQSVNITILSLLIVPITNNSTIQNYPPYTKEPLVKTSGSFGILLHIYYINNTVFYTT